MKNKKPCFWECSKQGLSKQFSCSGSYVGNACGNTGKELKIMEHLQSRSMSVIEFSPASSLNKQLKSNSRRLILCRLDEHGDDQNCLHAFLF